jgi:hypothetical protein
MSRCADLFTAETDPASFANAGLPLSWNTEESVNSGAVSRSADPSSQQLTRRIKRNELNPLFAEVLGRPFQPIDEGDDLLDARAAPSHRAHRLHHRAAFGGDVVEQDDGAVGLEIAVDLSLGAVVLDLLAHHEAVDGAAMPAAGAHGDDDRDGAELQAADRIEVALVLEQVEHELGDEMRPLRVEHRRLHVEVVVAHRPGHELEAAEQQRFRLDDLEQPRLLLRQRGRRRRCGRRGRRRARRNADAARTYGGSPRHARLSLRRAVYAGGGWGRRGLGGNQQVGGGAYAGY